MSNPDITTRSVEQRGIELPWERVERYGPGGRMPDGSDRPPKGTVLESGTVFIPLDDLDALADQGVWDSHFGGHTLLLGYREGLALEAAGFAVEETKGGFYGTDELREWLRKEGLRDE